MLAWDAGKIPRIAQHQSTQQTVGRDTWLCGGRVRTQDPVSVDVGLLADAVGDERLGCRVRHRADLAVGCYARLLACQRLTKPCKRRSPAMVPAEQLSDRALHQMAVAATALRRLQCCSSHGADRLH